MSGYVGDLSEKQSETLTEVFKLMNEIIYQTIN